MNTLADRPKMIYRDNVHLSLKNPDGSIQKIWQPNELGMAWFKYHGSFRYDPNYGSWEDSIDISNLVVNAGIAGYIKRIGGIGSVAAFTYMAIGTGTNAAAAGDTALQTEITTGGGQRVNLTPTSSTTTVTDDTINWVNTFTFTSTFAVSEVGILNAASGGVLGGRVIVPTQNVVNGSTLQVTYKVTGA